MEITNKMKELHRIVWNNKQGEFYTFYGSEMATLKVMKNVCLKAEKSNIGENFYNFTFNYLDIAGTELEPFFTIFIHKLDNYGFVNYGSSIRNVWTEGLGTTFVKLMRDLTIEQIYEAWNLDENEI